MDSPFCLFQYFYAVVFKDHLIKIYCLYKEFNKKTLLCNPDISAPQHIPQNVTGCFPNASMEKIQSVRYSASRIMNFTIEN